MYYGAIQLKMYEYSARLEKVIDGDTIIVLIDLGFKITIKQTLRLAGINCPELPGELGTKAKEFTENALQGRQFTIKTLKDKQEKYGRYLAVIYVDNQTKSLNEILLDNNMAVKY